MYDVQDFFIGLIKRLVVKISGPFLDPYYNTAPNILGYPKKGP